MGHVSCCFASGAPPGPQSPLPSLSWHRRPACLRAPGAPTLWVLRPPCRPSPATPLTPHSRPLRRYAYLTAFSKVTRAWLRADGNADFPDAATLQFGAGRAWWAGLAAGAGLVVGLAKAALGLDEASRAREGRIMRRQRLRPRWPAWQRLCRPVKVQSVHASMRSWGRAGAGPNLVHGE